MAIQILPKTNLGQRLGSALGTGLGAGIQGLVQNKLGELERNKGIQKAHSGLKALGINPDLANLPENLQPIALKQALQQPGQQEYANILQQLLGGNQQLGNHTSIPNFSGLNQQQASELTRLGLQKQQFDTKEARIQQHHVDKETKPYYDEIFKSYKAAKNTNPVLNRMELLLKKGNLPNPAFFGLANRVGGAFGLNVSALINADAEEFEKLTGEFLKNAKDIFGSRLTNYDVSTFLKGIPTLSQSNQGKQRIINNLRTVNEGALIKQKALSDIIKENGGKRPSNLSELVEERVESQLDKLAESFASGTPLGSTVRNEEKSVLNNNPTIELSQNQSKLPHNQQNKTPLEQIPLTGTQLSKGKEPTALQQIGRHAGRTVARGLESIANIPADIASLGLSAADLATLGKIPQISKANEFVRENLNARNITKGLTGENFEPKNETERRGDEIVSDFASFLVSPGTKAKVIPAIVKTAIGNTAGFLGEKIGGAFGNSELGKGIAKIGSVLLYSFSGGRKALEEIRDKSGKVIDKLSGTTKTVARKLEKDLEIINKDLTTGVKTAGKTFVKDAIEDLPKLVENGKASVKELWDAKVDLNKLYSDPDTPSTAKKYIRKLVSSINNTIDNYGKRNKSFRTAVNEVNDIHLGLNQASDIAKTIQKSVDSKKLTSPLIKSLLHGAIVKSPGILGTAAAGLGAGLGIQKLTRFTQLLQNSSQAKKYYKNILQAAVVNNASLMNRNAKRLDEIAAKEGY